MKESGFTIRDIDNLLENLYQRLRGKKEGLSLVEPAAILLSWLKESDRQAYDLYISRFIPVLIDALVAESFVSFGYDGLTSLLKITSDIPLLAGEYMPDTVDRNIRKIREKIARIDNTVDGKGDETNQAGSGGTKGDARSGFFHENLFDSAGIPFVSLYSTGSVPLTTGRVIELSISLKITGEWSIRKKYKPAVTFDHISAEPNSIFEKQVFTAINAAEKFVSSSLKMRGIFRIPRQYTVSFPEIASLPDPISVMVTGGSAGLAITAILISLLGKLELVRSSCQIRPRTAFTGTIDDSGNIVPVEEGFLKEKVRSVFFSTCERFVVPGENMTTACECRKTFINDHPERRLEIIPVSDISRLCGERRVMEERTTSRLRSILQYAFHLRKHIITGTSVTVAALIYLFSIQPYLDDTISNVEFADSTLIMKNNMGKPIADYNVGFTQHGKNDTGYERYFIDDYDNDGKIEVVCLLAESRKCRLKAGQHNRIHIMIFDDIGSMVQKYIIDDEKILGAEIGTNGTEFPLLVRNCHILNDDSGQALFYIVANHTAYCPGVLIRYSIRDNTAGLFFHKGMLRDIRVGDYDNDGQTEIMLSGYNIDLEAAVMIGLDPGYMNGSSPKGYCYTAPGYTDDIAKYIVMLPDYDKYVKFRNEMGMNVTFHETTKDLSVLVKSRRDDVRFFFDSDLSCYRAQVVDCKQLTANSTVTRDDVRTVYYKGREEDEKWLARNVKYWDGTRWVDTPVISSSYLKSIAANNTAPGQPR